MQTESHGYVLCHACDYDMTGAVLIEGVVTCPECGFRQAPTPMVRWPAAWARLLVMLVPAFCGMAIAVAGAMTRIKPVMALGLAGLVLGSIIGPIVLTRSVLRRGYVSERRAAAADRLLVLAIFLGFVTAAACIALCWDRLRDLN